jgi:type VI secretion system protein ImpI
MRLMLEVISPHASSMGSNRHKSVGPEGARIGRGPTNDWVINDIYISGHQATIRCLNGLFFIEGKGRNPIAINDRSRPLKNDDPQLLNTGDHVFLDEYEVSVRVAPDEALEEPPPPEPVQPQHLQVEIEADPLHGYVSSPGGSDILDLLPEEERSPQPRERSRAGSSEPILEAAVEPILASADPDSPINDDWFRTKVQPKPPDPGQSSPVRRAVSKEAERSRRIKDSRSTSNVSEAGRDSARPAPDANPPLADAFARMLSGAGIDPAKHRIDAEVAREFGQVLRVVVAGTMDALRARAALKYEFRLPETRIQPSHNNPLKYSATVADALENLLIKRNAAYLPTVEAFSDAFDEIRAHQLAMLAGTQAGIEAMFAHFDPEALIKRFEKSAPRPMVPLGSLKARYWDQFAELYRELAEDPQDAFSRLFGRAFAKKYDEELKRAKAESQAARAGKGERS